MIILNHFLFLFSSLYLFLGQLLWPVAFWDGVLLWTPADLTLKLRKFQQFFFLLTLQSWGFRHGQAMWLPCGCWHLNSCPHDCTPNALSYWAISLALKCFGDSACFNMFGNIFPKGEFRFGLCGPRVRKVAMAKEFWSWVQQAPGSRRDSTSLSK